MVNYTGKHGPAEPGDPIPDSWPLEFVEEMYEAEAVGSPQKWGQFKRRLEGRTNDDTDDDEASASGVVNLEGTGKTKFPKGPKE
jgi:hypothetical protein